MKTLKCKNCGGMIEWRRGDGQMEYTADDLIYTIGCPSCRQNIVYGHKELPQYIVDEPTHDTVNHPSHYTYGKIEVIDFIEQVVADYDPKEAVHVANVIKYLARAQHKGTPEEDKEKALQYCYRLTRKKWLEK